MNIGTVLRGPSTMFMSICVDVDTVSRLVCARNWTIVGLDDVVGLFCPIVCV